MSDLSTENNVLSTQYWSDAVQTRIALVDDVLQQVPPSALTDTKAFDLVDGEMAAIRRALRTIGTRRNALTPTCRIPTEILGEIFLFYQQASAGPYILECANDSTTARLTLKNTALRWVPGVAHVCRHWRVVAFEHPRLWSHVMLHLGREWASRMLSLSKSSPITISLADPDPCEASMRLDPWALPPPPTMTMMATATTRRRCAQLDPIDVLAQHLFHIQDLDLSACSCSILPWVRLIETAAPLLEVFWLRVDAHRPGTRHDTVVHLPRNFLSTHPRLRRLIVDGAFLSSWDATGPPLASLTLLNICAPDPRKLVVDRAKLAVPTHDEFLDCLLQMPALESLVLSHCLPPFATAFSTRSVSLPRLRTLSLHDRVDRCRQALDALDVPPEATIKVSCWSICPPSEHDCLRVLPSLSAHLCRENKHDNNNNARTGPIGPGSGGPHALSLSSTSIDGRTEFVLAAWRTFVPPTVAEDREQYFGPKSVADVRLECEWDASDNDPEMERRALRRACAGVPLDELRALSVRAEAAMWDPRDWYDTFVASGEMTHVEAVGPPGESVLDALKLPLPPPDNASSDASDHSNSTGNSNDDAGAGGGSGDDGSNGGTGTDVGGGGEGSGEDVASPALSAPAPPPAPPLFPELVSLTLSGVNFVRADDAAWLTLSSAMAKRQASPACVTILDRIELRRCTVAEWMVDGLNELAAVVVWDSVTDPDNWMHVPREVEGEEDDDDDEDEG